MSQTIAVFLQEAETHLTHHEIENPRAEARYILSHVTGWARQVLVAYPEKKLLDDHVIQAHEMVRLRARHVPMAHLTGTQEFWGLLFKVTPDTLIPRADSETLIETALDLFSHKTTPIKILDLGVGSGCLLISALHEFSSALGIGVDQSKAALLVALENAQALGVVDRCRMIEGNWGQALQGSFDLILANPPYISVDETGLMSREVLEYEPKTALFAQQQGLAAYQEIAADLSRLLAKGGVCLFEIGFQQSQQVQQIMTDQGLHIHGTRQDLQGHDRVVIVGK